MRSSLPFLDIAKEGINSPLRWFKVELFTFLWTFPGAVMGVIIAFSFGGDTNAKAPRIFESIQPPALALFAMLLPFLTALYGICRQIPRQHSRHWQTIVTPYTRINWAKMRMGAVVWGAILLADGVVGYMLAPERYTWSFQPVQWLLLLVVAMGAIPFQAALEEFAFRGYFMQTTALVSKRVWQPLVLTSVSFGMLHYANPEVDAYGWVMMISYIGMGLMLGVATLMDDGIELAIGAHAANNILSGLLVTEAHSVFQTPSLFRLASEPPSAVWLFVDTFVPGIIFLLILAKIYQWGSWKRLLAPIWDVPEPEIPIIPDSPEENIGNNAQPTE
ncbi:MAG: CPBP family intramembrane glutamic endopeptidase [Candidatus Kapaibacteriota bacterium]